MMKTIRILPPAAAVIAAAAGVAFAQPAAPAAALAGKDVYEANCAACHQEDGKGIPGAFPALAGDAFVTGDANQPIGVVLEGRGGMPTFKDEMDDAHIAAAISYIRTSWGNAATPVTPAAVAARRSGAMVPDKLSPLGAH